MGDELNSTRVIIPEKEGFGYIHQLFFYDRIIDYNVIHKDAKPKHFGIKVLASKYWAIVKDEKFVFIESREYKAFTEDQPIQLTELGLEGCHLEDILKRENIAQSHDYSQNRGIEITQNIAKRLYEMGNIEDQNIAGWLNQELIKDIFRYSLERHLHISTPIEQRKPNTDQENIIKNPRHQLSESEYQRLLEHLENI